MADEFELVQDEFEPVEPPAKEAKPSQADMIGKLPPVLDQTFGVSDLVDSGKAAVIGALPPAFGATYDVATDLALKPEHTADMLHDLPVRASGNEQFARTSSILDDWQAAKERRQGILGRSQAERPIPTLVGQVVGGAMIAAPAMAALPAAAGPLTQLATASTVNRLAEKGDPVSLPQDVATDVGTAGLLKGGLDLAKGGIVAAGGRLAQMPQRVTELASDKFGGTRAVRFLAGDEVRPLPEGASPRITALREQQMAGDVGVQAAREMSEAINSVGGLAGQRIASVTPSDRQAIAEQMATLFQKRGSTVSADDLVRNWDELAPRMFLRADKDSVADLLRSVNTRDEAYLAALGSNIAMRARVVGKSGSQIAPVKQMLDASEASHNEYLVGKMTRGGQAATPGAEQGAFHVEPGVAPQSAQDKMSLRLAQAAERGEAKIDQIRSPEGVTPDYLFPRGEMGNVARMGEDAADEAINKYRPYDERVGKTAQDRLLNAWRETKSPLGAAEGPLRESQVDTMSRAREAYPKISERYAQNLDADIENVMSKAREFREAMEQSRAVAADFGRTKKMAGEAAGALDRQAVGRQAIGNVAGIGAAMMSGGGLAGTGGAVLAAATGKPLGRGILKGIDIASAIGQKLEKVQPLVDKFAASDTPIGKSIRWALNADGEAMLVRLAAIADLPGVD